MGKREKWDFKKNLGDCNIDPMLQLSPAGSTQRAARSKTAGRLALRSALKLDLTIVVHK